MEGKLCLPKSVAFCDCGLAALGFRQGFQSRHNIIVASRHSSNFAIAPPTGLDRADNGLSAFIDGDAFHPD